MAQKNAKRSRGECMNPVNFHKSSKSEDAYLMSWLMNVVRMKEQDSFSVWKSNLFRPAVALSL